MSITVRGTGDFSKALASLAVRVDVANTVGLMQAAALVEGEIKRQITGGHPKGTKTGATVGGPPQNISGTLRRSVTAIGPEPLGADTWRARIGPTVKYGRHVELGGPNWPSGVTYPYVKPGLDAALAGDRLRTIAARAWGQAIER